MVSSCKKAVTKKMKLVTFASSVTVLWVFRAHSWRYQWIY